MPAVHANNELTKSPRYCERPLPTTPYLPGGHSHNDNDSTAPDLRAGLSLSNCEAEHWAECTAYLYAVDLYNAGFWYEAKSLWRELADKSPDRPEQQAFLTGLSHAADALLVRRMGWRSGVAQARGRCAHIFLHLRTRHYMGLPVDAWYKRLDRCLRPGGMDFPRIELSQI